MVRTAPAAEDSFAAILALSKFGIAIAAMIRMIATTISNSIREKPFCFFMMLDLLEKFYDARARHTYRKPATISKSEVAPWSFLRNAVKIQCLMNLFRLRLPMPLPKTGQNTLELPFFVYP